ncbi:MAG TPA: hypothetical protein VGF59_30475 [Bryobacteraceae bacterium]|jgi:hypothetical protein
MPADALDLLRAMSGVVRRPAWRVIVAALEAYGGGPRLTPEQMRAVRAVRRIHARSS